MNSDYKTKTILVTGGNGFIGKQVVRLCVENKWSVVNVDRFCAEQIPGVTMVEANESDPKFWQSCFQHYAPDVIIHLAGERSSRDPERLFQWNVVLTHKILEGIVAADKHISVVLADSAASLGIPTELPVSEEHACIPVNPYGISKLCQAMIARSYSLQHDIPLIIGRIFNITGPGEPKGLVCRDMAEKIIGAHAVLQFRDPAVTRDFLDVRDVALALVVLADRGTPGKLYNICSNKEVSLRVVSEILAELIRKPVQIQWNGSEGASGVARIFGSNKKLTSLGWRPQFHLRQSIEEMLTQLQTSKSN